MTVWLWCGFIAFVLVMLWLDLGVVNRRPHEIRAREAMTWTGFCVFLALLFAVAVYFIYENHWLGVGADTTGRLAAVQYLTGWLLEYSLSMDNLFVIAAIFTYFKVPRVYQHRVLFWGILGAVVLRGVMILAGAALIRNFSWITYVFGSLLLFSAVKMLVIKEDDIDWEASLIVRLVRRFIPIAPKPDGQKFLTRLEDGRLAATPLLVVLLLVESADVIFAVDSIPAIFVVTSDPFLVFTSNVFAILGLRSLFFALSSFMDKFRYLRVALVFVLAYLGVKMLLAHTFKIDTLVSLAIIVGILAVGVGASLVGDRRERARPEPPLGAEVEQIAKMTIERVWMIGTLIVGSLLLVGGIVMALPLVPGPGLVIAFVGLAILATRFAWARRPMVALKRKIRAAVRRVSRSRAERREQGAASTSGHQGARTGAEASDPGEVRHPAA